MAFGSQQSNKNVSLQEQQKRLQDEIVKQQGEQRKQLDAHFGAEQAASWNRLGDGRTTPNSLTSPPTYTATDEYGGQRLSRIINKPFAGIPNGPIPTATSPADTEDDILAAYNASAPVNSSSHTPPPSNKGGMDSSKPSANHVALTSGPGIKGPTRTNGVHTDDLHDGDDDPFGLGTGKFFRKPEVTSTSTDAKQDDDDVLGLLARPVSEFSKQRPTEEDKAEEASRPTSGVLTNGQDRAIAELVDMGFEPENSRRALEATESGSDVQAAVGWLLNQAHKHSRNKEQQSRQDDGQIMRTRSQQARKAPGRRKSSGSSSVKPTWLREQERSTGSQNRQDSRSAANGDKDPSQYAAEIGTRVFKTANSLWKTGTKRLNQAVSEFNSDSDSGQPKWMKEARPEAEPRKLTFSQRDQDANDHERMERKSHQNPAARASGSSVTDEALMLEADLRPPQRKHQPKTEVPEDVPKQRRPASNNRSQEKSKSETVFLQKFQERDPRSKLSRQAAEDEMSQAYISPARRKKTITKPAQVNSEPGPEPDLLFDSTRPSSRPQPPPAQARPTPRTRSPAIASLLTRPPPPKRNIPAVSPAALRASTESRQAGTSAFKRGDYALASTHYTTSLSAIPPTHPLTLPLLTNRALAHLKTGDPKAAIADAESAINLIGPSRGSSERIDLEGPQGMKPMTTYWEKAMMRQAEALEQLERWSEAATIWKTCVEAGVGGATSIAGRNRCEKAAAGSSQVQPSAAPKKEAPKPRPKASALSDLAPDSTQSTEAVSRLRAAHAAADRIDEEKFALADVVDSRILRWSSGKEGNLRALLSTLENVLWEGSGWKKVGMGELLLPGKVKINYTKGIAKVHPDKVSE